jgi:hypothetical protein
MESLYKCECGYETHDKSHMRDHLNRKRPCIKGRDMSSIDINNTMIRNKKISDLSNYTDEEKKVRKNEQSNKRNLKRAAIGGRNELQYTKYMLSHMIQSSVRRKHPEPEFTTDTLFQILKDNSVYKIETTIGNLEIPLVLTNGYINSASVDRIDNSKGYMKDNIRIIPKFLNVDDEKMSKINLEDWDEILIARENPRNYEELFKIGNSIQNTYISKTFFYKLANSAYWHSINNNLVFNFNSIKECASFLIEKFIEQGGRCAYLKIPIFLESKHKFKASIERINHTIGYKKDNIVLIVSSLNCPPSGPKGSSETALGLNLDKLNKWTLLTKELEEKIDKQVEIERNTLSLIFEDLNIKEQNKKTSKYKGVHLHYNKFYARILFENKRIFLGSFKTEQEAAKAYNMKAIELYGDKANLNVIKE